MFTYKHDMPDACALVCRRLVELLLIKSFEANGKESVILDGNEDFVGLGAIIGQAKSGKHFKLDKDTKTVLEDVYRLGNDAAHSEFYAIQKRDFDKFGHLMDKALSELLNKAKIQRNMRR
jgi:hypothetical protein